jgi:hypothetical protein
MLSKKSQYALYALIHYESCTRCKDENTCGIRSVLKELRNATEACLRCGFMID